MKKYLIIIGIITLFITLLIQGNKIDIAQACINKYKIIKIVDADTFYIDYNKDGYAQKNEKVRIKHSDGFETSFKITLNLDMLHSALMMFSFPISSRIFLSSITPSSLMPPPNGIDT